MLVSNLRWGPGEGEVVRTSGGWGGGSESICLRLASGLVMVICTEQSLCPALWADSRHSPWEEMLFGEKTKPLWLVGACWSSQELGMWWVEVAGSRPAEPLC